MPTINNSKLIKNIIDTAKLNISRDQVPTELASKIVPVLEVSPGKIINLFETKSQTITGNIYPYTTPNDKTFYLSQISLSMIKDAACDIASGNIIVYVTLIKGNVQQAISIPVLTLTAQSEEQKIKFNPPIQLMKNSSIFVTGTFTLGNLIRSVKVLGHIEENE